MRDKDLNAGLAILKITRRAGAAYDEDDSLPQWGVDFDCLYGGHANFIC